MVAHTIEDAGKLGNDYFDSSLQSFAAFTKTAQAIAVETTDFTKKAVEAGNAAFERLVNAKSLEKAIEVQTDYAKTSYESFVAQATRMGELHADLGKDLYKPFEAVVAKAT